MQLHEIKMKWTRHHGDSRNGGSCKPHERAEKSCSYCKQLSTSLTWSSHPLISHWSILTCAIHNHKPLTAWGISCMCSPDKSKVERRKARKTEGEIENEKVAERRRDRESWMPRYPAFNPTVTTGLLWGLENQSIDVALSPICGCWIFDRSGGQLSLLI